MTTAGLLKCAVHKKWSTCLLLGIILSGSVARTAIERGTVMVQAHVPGDLSRLPPDLPIDLPDSWELKPTHIPLIDRSPVLAMGDPGKIRWNLRGDERTFNLGYGIEAGAYLNGETDGVGFSISLETSDGPKLLYRRVLTPKTRESDRGEQRAHIVLPPFSLPAKFVLEWDAGYGDDQSWDWAFLSRARFQHDDHYLLEQFPSFETIPSAVDFSPFSFVFQNGKGATAMLIHAPSRLTFDLSPPRPSRLRFNYGFLPGAYTDGQTDGAEFTVKLVGDFPKDDMVLFSRHLTPTSDPSHRGRQSADIALPAPTQGYSRVLVSIDPGPQENAAWDWAYLSHLELR